MVINRVPYVSYNNLGWLITKRPLALVELAVIGIIILALVFFQFAFLINGVDRILHGNDHRIIEIVKESLYSLAHIRFSGFILFIPYFVVILPFSDFYLSSPLLAKIQIPAFILQTIYSNIYYLVPVIILAIIVSYLALRFIQVLPLVILHNVHGIAAVKISWRMTKSHLWSYLWRLGFLGLATFISTGLISIILYLIQSQLDKSSHVVAFTGAVINMGLMSLFVRLISAAMLVIFVLFLLLANDKYETIHSNEPQVSLHASSSKIGRRSAIALILVFLFGQISFNVYYLRGATLDKPITISHRGVDDGNGVQNTIPALDKTSKEKPDYVEMDIHETKDHQFVVMHDENLKHLTGVNKSPYQLTLKQITKLTASENGYHAHVASFSDYLSAAEKDHQKLLVEIKVTKHDSKNMLSLFKERYGKRLMKDHDMVHSLSFPVIKGLKKSTPKLPVSFILPYNLTFPQTDADAYTVEETTLDSSFVSQAHYNHQKVFAWTVDSNDDMTRMIFLNVDGIITDNLKELKENINSTFNDPTYANRLLIYSDELDNLTSYTETVPN
ncbi:glycerophosphoryl diester phosphodiesterase [Paucilactobacillus suebicus DSM 5007 = KCTC 3549]|uniref:Glycerophosphoryl diester phosphodiesterase n=2 Tax=Paucilactobacillus suebicus TaxID=152335 RepID=A0A0R1W0A4_9LACO|nr:glycerophosphoryl diester phosphodiesterase [Paucilactobacillus suebicus DSM 5007 = KCTC 3549]